MVMVRELLRFSHGAVWSITRPSPEIVFPHAPNCTGSWMLLEYTGARRLGHQGQNFSKSPLLLVEDSFMSALLL